MDSGGVVDELCGLFVAAGGVDWLDAVRVRNVLRDAKLQPRQRSLLGHVVTAGELGRVSQSPHSAAHSVAVLCDDFAIDPDGARWAVAVWLCVIHPQSYPTAHIPVMQSQNATVEIVTSVPTQRSVSPVGTGTNFALPPGATSPWGVVFDGANVWTANYVSNNVTRINPSTGAGTNFALPPGARSPVGVVFDGANVWTTNRGSNNVTRIDPSTGTGTNFALPPGATNPEGVVFDGANVWTVNNGSHNVTRLNI